MTILNAQSGFSGILNMLPLMIIMFLIMYFIIIRPQKKQQKEFDEAVKQVIQIASLRLDELKKKNF